MTKPLWAIPCAAVFLPFLHGDTNSSEHLPQKDSVSSNDPQDTATSPCCCLCEWSAATRVRGHELSKDLRGWKPLCFPEVPKIHMAHLHLTFLVLRCLKLGFYAYA